MQIVTATQSKLLLQGEMELSEYILKNEDQSCVPVDSLKKLRQYCLFHLSTAFIFIEYPKNPLVLKATCMVRLTNTGSFYVCCQAALL